MLLDFFRRRTAANPTADAVTTRRVARRSSGLAEFTKLLAGRENLTVLDLGPTSPQNIRHITELGHRVYNEDVLLSSLNPDLTIKDANGATTIDVDRFLGENLKYEGQHFDAVLCWDVPDYLNEALVKASIERISKIMKPGGVLLAFFHTKDAGPDSPYFRYHIAGPDSLDLQRGPQFRLQRIFNNRHIENLFHEFSNIKFFLARDNVREVLVVR
jgi:SAM-dependent methyltransferase